MSRPWSDEAIRDAGELLRACAAEYHAAWWDDPRLRDALDRARDDLRAILDYRRRVRRAHAAILAGASLNEVEP